MKFAFERAISCALASRQCFLENGQRPFRIAAARFGLGQRDLDDPVEHHGILLPQAFDAPAHGLESVGERAPVGLRPAD